MRRSLVALLLLGGVFPWRAGAVNADLGTPPADVDRSTPLATVHGFLNAVHEGDYAQAAFYLDLDHYRHGEQPQEGPRLARRLRFVIDRKLVVDFSAISKEPAGDPTNPKWDQIGTVPLGNTKQPVRLSRLVDDHGAYVWVFSPDTVKAIDKLFDEYGPPFAEKLPEAFYRHSFLGLETWQWIGLALLILVGGALALLVERLLVDLFTGAASLTAVQWDDALAHATRGPLKIPIFCALLALGTRWLQVPPEMQDVSDTLARSAMIVSVAWLLLRWIRVFSTTVQTNVDNPSGDLSRLQGMRTQLAVLQRIFSVVTYLVATAMLLMQFDVVRHVGVSLLASAGLAGLVVGVAAQKSISTLLAGIQLTLTQPIRLGDTVVVEGESGVVEEITLTYVIVRVWDLRRLLIPMTYFLEKPFQNWSKGAHALSATISLVTAKTVDVDAFRVETKRTLEGEGKDLWDGHYPNLIVTENSGSSLVIRVLVGAKDKAGTWELRTLLQKRLNALLAAHPEWMPRSFEEPASGR